MRIESVLLAAVLTGTCLTGCLSSAPAPATNWYIEVNASDKVASVNVVAPYNSNRLAVLRADGSVAFDPLNAFAASPAALISGQLISRQGVGTLTVMRLALDCRQPGKRLALVELRLDRNGQAAFAKATVPTADGNYTAAFSAALERAYADALASSVP